MRDTKEEIKRLKDQLNGASKQKQKEINKRIAKLRHQNKNL
jgi:hypothetical protein